MDKLLERSASETEWGTPDVLWGLSMAADADPDQARRMVVFLSNLASSSLTPPLIVRIRGSTWSNEALDEWRRRSDLPDRVRSVLTTKSKVAK
jgi:predicted KAP-like P-loop ATPase